MNFGEMRVDAVPYGELTSLASLALRIWPGKHKCSCTCITRMYTFPDQRQSKSI